MDIDKAKEEENFIKENQVFFKKYKIIKKLAEGAFGDVYIGSNISTNDPVAIKVEPRKIAKPLLESEAYFLFQLRGVGIPEVLSFGRKKNYNILIEPLLGKSLFDIFNERRKHMHLQDICLIAKQILDRIQWVHSKGFVHRDIKPDNFLIGKKDPNVIYLIDFGLSKKYKSDKTGKHLKFSFTGKLTGTVRFASANALRGGEQSRRDDLESIAYMIIFFMRGKLPWQGVTGTKKMERYLKIYKMKKNVTPEDLCKSLPAQMVQFTKYVKHLEFEQEPDYNYLRGLINSILKQRKINLDSLIFSWISYEDLKNIKDPINPATRKDSPQGRLYRKIENKLKRERNNSSDNDSGEKTFQSNTYNIISQDKEENYTSKDEAEIECNYKSKAEKSKEGLNTLMANLNKTLDENVNFEDIEKKDPNIEKMKKKNYTVNDVLDFNSEKKYNQNNNEDIRDKSEEIRLSNKNERKMSLIQIDEKEEQNKNNNNNSSEEKDEKNKNKNKEKVAKKEINNEEYKNIKHNSNDIPFTNKHQQQIIPIMQGKMKINNIIDNKIQKNNNRNNNINLVNINSYIERHIEIPENSNININDNLQKMEKDKMRTNSKENSQNIIQIQKKNNSPNKLIKKLAKTNQENIRKEKKEINNKNNKNYNDKINKSTHMSKDTKNLQLKTNNNSNIQRINIQTQKINLPKKLMTENDEGPMDNNRKKLIELNKNKVYNTEINNMEIKNDSSKNNSQYITNKKKLQKNINNYDRRSTPNNISNMKKKKINEIVNNKVQTNISTYNNKNDVLAQFLPQNSDEILNNNFGSNKVDKIDKNNNLINFNEENIKGKKLSKSLNLFKNDGNENNYYYNNNIKANENINSNINSTKNNKEIINKDNMNNNFINNFGQAENNNININKNNYSNTNMNKENLKNVEFNNINNRKVRIVNRNKNPNNIMNSNKEFNNLNTKTKKIYNTFSERIANGCFNNTEYKTHNININNNINNNIIINNNINNKYSNPNNSSLRSNSNNPYSTQNVMPNNFILNKRPSHNINSSKMMRSFNMYINTNPNQNPNSIQYMKRPSYNIKNNMNMNINTNINSNINSNINQNYNPMKEIFIATKRPSYNTYFSVSNCLNNTEPKKNPPVTTKIKKLTSNNMDQHRALTGKNIEVIRDIRDIKSRGLGIGYGQDNFGHFNKTFENNTTMNNNLMNQYNIKNNSNINNNVIVNKGNIINNSSKIIAISDKIPMNQFINNNPNMNPNFGNNNNNNNKIRIEKIPNYKPNYPNKVGNYQNTSNQFDNNMQNYGFNIY